MCFLGACLLFDFVCVLTLVTELGYFVFGLDFGWVLFMRLLVWVI